MLPARPLILFGPTASGKSRLALALARKLASNNTITHIVNCDSLQLYTHLPILTAQPSAEAKAETPHHLYAVAKPTERLSAGLYAEKAWNLLQQLHDKHPSDAVILCGGSGLYLKALLEGLTALPQPSREATQKVRRWQEENRDLYRLLQQRDPATAATLVAQDRHRIVRALEFYETCGSSLCDARQGIKQPSLFAQQDARQSIRQPPRQSLRQPIRESLRQPPRQSPRQPLLMSLVPCRQALYAAIDARFERMLKQGAIEEVRALQAARTLPYDSPLRGALGLKEIEAYCEGESSWQTMVERGQQRARHYAKRQLTWMRHQLPADKSLQGEITESLAEDSLDACQGVCQAWREASCPDKSFV